MAQLNSDEELGRHDSLQLSINTEASSSSEDEHIVPVDGRLGSILSSGTSFDNDSENEDRVPELSSLINNNGGFASYGGIIQDEPARIMHQRTLSDESIATVAALPGMVLRAHSVTNGKRGNCVIRHSSPKVGEYYLVQ